jgi:hypothetical protein
MAYTSPFIHILVTQVIARDSVKNSFIFVNNFIIGNLAAIDGFATLYDPDVDEY